MATNALPSQAHSQSKERDVYGADNNEQSGDHSRLGHITPQDAKQAYEGTPEIDVAEELRLAGVKRIEAISSQLGPKARILIFVGCFLVAYAYGLDGQFRYNFQLFAAGSFGANDLTATISVVRSVIGAAAQPTGGKIADVFGRLELLCVSIVFYAMGTIIEATSQNIETFSAGAVFYELGYTMAQLLIEVIIADLSSLRTRVFFSFVPAMPFLLNAWVAPLIYEAQVGTLGERGPSFWRIGVGIWAAIYPVASLLLLGVLYHAQRKAKRAGVLDDFRTPFQRRGWRIFIDLFWQCDVIGILLIIIALGFFLTPFTLAGGLTDLTPPERWRQAKIVAPVVVGIVFFPILFFWERHCKYPLIPFHLLRDRGVWAGFLIAMTLNAAWYQQFTFAYNLLIVGFDQTTRNTGFIQNIYSFVSTFTGILCGFLVMRYRRVKPFICFGAVMFMVAFGLLVRYRGSVTAASHELAGYIGAELVLGIGAGFFSYPTQAAVQARTKHEHVAVVTGLYLASYRVGSAVGNAIAGAVWTQRMPITLANNIADPVVAAGFYATPLTYVLQFPLGTPERTGAINAYGEVARILSIVGICLSALIIVWAFLLKDDIMGDSQSREDAEVESVDDSVNEEKQEAMRAAPWWKKAWNRLS